MTDAQKKTISTLEKDGAEERPTLDVLRKDLTAYLDLHKVFNPDTKENVPALLSITDELGERMDTLLKLAAQLRATTPGDIAKKLEIFSFAYDNSAFIAQTDLTDQLLLSSIQDLKALDQAG